MNARGWLPTLPQISSETLAVLAASLLAAYIISRFPQVQKFINDNSVTVKT
jgi:hypothetical protein